MNTLDKYYLCIKESYLSMLLYFEILYKMTGSDDLGASLGDMVFHPDGDTADPATWNDWLDIIAKFKNVSKEELSKKKIMLTVQESFMCMVNYLAFLCTHIESDDLNNFLFEMKSALNKDKSSSLIWKEFFEAVKKVKSTPIEILIANNTTTFS